MRTDAGVIRKIPRYPPVGSTFNKRVRERLGHITMAFRLSPFISPALHLAIKKGGITILLQSSSFDEADTSKLRLLYILWARTMKLSAPKIYSAKYKHTCVPVRLILVNQICACDIFSIVVYRYIRIGSRICVAEL